MAYVVPIIYEPEDPVIINKKVQRNNSETKVKPSDIEVAESDSQSYVNKQKLKMSSESDKRNSQDTEELTEDCSDHDNGQKIIDNIKIKKKIQNIMRCKRYRAKKKIELSSQNAKRGPMTPEEAEKIKRRKELAKQHSKRYRDRQRTLKLLKLQSINHQNES